MMLRYLLILFIGVIPACAHNGSDYGCNLQEIADGQPPLLLSTTRCVNMKNPAQAVAGTIPYDLNVPFWSDGAEKWRYMALPEKARIEIDAGGDFLLPVGTVLIKHFRLKERFIETRFFVHTGADTWNGYSYQWDDSQTEARLLNTAKEITVGEQVWHFPGRDECLKCHTAAAGFSLGLEVSQLNKDYSYSPDDNPVNQLDYLQARGVLATELSASMRSLKLAASKDPTQSLTERARAYLHSNCSQCHRPGGGTQSTLDLRAGIAFADTKACDVWPLLGDFGITNPRLLAPGDHARSILWSRMHKPDNNRMPPWFNKVVDVDGVRLIEQWIDSLPGCT